MAKAKSSPKYICSNCGIAHTVSMGKCHNCGKWGTIEENQEVVEAIAVAKTVSNKSSVACLPGTNISKKLSEVKTTENFRIKTGIGEFDRVVGGGVVRNSVTIITAPPGAGKSTLLIKVSNTVASLGYKVIYATGEEDETQVKDRADRVLESISDNLKIVSTNKLEDIKASIEEEDAKFIVVDSIQAVTLSHVDSAMGSIKQTNECAHLITKMAKDKSRPRAFVIVGQKTKNDEMAGSRQLEHLVDTVIHLDTEGDMKILRAVKNRFGDIDEVGIFEMASDGMHEVKDMSKKLVTERDCPIAGSALSVIREGKRPMVVEIESLVSKSFAPYPSRNCESFRRDTLNMLVSVIAKKALIRMDDQDVLLKPTGDIRINESSSNLAAIMSMISSAKDKPIPSGIVFVGEVGLTGEVKKVSYLEARVKEVDRLGFREIVIPNQPLKLDENELNIKITRVKDINECKKRFEM